MYAWDGLVVAPGRWGRPVMMREGGLGCGESAAAGVDAGRKVIMLFEPDVALSRTRVMLLRTLGLCVTAVGTYAEACALPAGLEPVVAALTLVPSERDAGRVAELVRRRWPWARILLLGTPGARFDDWLYDERLLYGWTPAELLAGVSALLA